ncbi:hypothetical protein [Intestinirhabdus alba]|jgi:hypothetical protein|uniref:Uncharacterized protein n=1 Tax=Intestinirhabdus alba TaxID=2899544 RepID=A0A6L6ITW2_9ENTR|nr:hypothetical protein [Intestinirhabdus alba]MTH48173.1 hypothetical protein [Intestinirhabdus alba]
MINGKIVIIFYCLGGSALVYFGIKLIKDEHRGYSFALIACVITSCIIVSSFSSLSTGIWWVLVIVLTFTMLFVVLFLSVIIKNYLMTRYINSLVTQLKNTPSFNLAEHLIKEHHKYQWYALHFPLENTFELGFNFHGINPVIGKKLYIKTLTGRHLHFIPMQLPQEIDFNSTTLSVLPSFYSFNQRTKALVDDYLLRIKDNHKTPWIINDVVDKE